VTLTPPASDAGDVWLVHLSARPVPGTAARVSVVDVPKCTILTMVVEEDDSTIRLLELADLPLGAPREPGLRHVKAVVVALVDLLAAAPGTVVLAAVDRVAQLASWEVVQELDHVVVASTLDAAIRAVAVIQTAVGPDEVLHPPGFSVALSVADAGIGCPASSQTLVDVDSGSSPRGGLWLSVRDQDLQVWTQGMSSWSARAVTTRRGRRPRVADEEPRRLLLGPANYAGQGAEWARAVREHAPGWTARNMHVVDPRGFLVFGADLPLTTVEWAEPATRVDLAVELVVGATDIVVEGMRPLLAAGDPSDLAKTSDPIRAREDVDSLRSSGRNVALLFHGSEVRRPREHARLTPWSPFYQPQTRDFTQHMERKTDRTHDALSGFDGLLLVSTLDLLDHVPGAVWLPVVVGRASFARTAPALAGGRPVVAHAPSSSWLKGSEWVDPVLRRMDRDGLLTYRRMENIPPIMVPSLLREVDVLVDQIVLGNPGVIAVQAMAAGRLVLAHLPEHVRRRFPEPPPVVEATPETLEQVLLSVIENPEHYSQIAARGVGFARKYHDGRLSAQVLAEALSS
jgi:hypothetical protein